MLLFFETQFVYIVLAELQLTQHNVFDLLLFFVFGDFILNFHPLLLYSIVFAYSSLHRSVTIPPRYYESFSEALPIGRNFN